VDQRQRGLEAAALLQRVVRGEIEAHMAFRKLPLLIHIVQQFTSDGPMADIFREVSRLNDEPHVLSVSVLPGYIYADVPDMGVSVVVVADNPHAAERAADELAAYVFSMRAALNAELPDTVTAVAEAIRTPGTVCLMDGGDNIGGGGPGDATILLAEILRQRGERACVVLLDPEAVKTCEEAGAGGEVSLEVGAKTDDQHGSPVVIHGTVRGLSDGRFVEAEARHGGMRDCDQGPTAIVDTDDGHTVVLNSLRIMPTSLNQLTSLGLTPTDFELIVVKGVTAPREAYDPIAAKVIAVDTPGVTRAGPETFVYANRPKPLYPLEPDTQWPPTS
jgi:microcystin degradation protein MlrC